MEFLLRDSSLPSRRRSLFVLQHLQTYAAPEIQLDIPYVHQLYDTPDWFNGNSACAPTQAIMVLAYYGLLPQWNITCSGPSYHVTPWGNYVADKYRFRLTEFSAQAASGSTFGAGGYGYMWASGSPHTRMADYFRAHGMTAEQTESTPHSVALAEIAGGYPFSMCVLLTTAGHLVLAHGIGVEPHTLVFNDPYGDKNRGYPNYYGKDVRYDWPGYNNGYQNLNQVAWCIATRATSPLPADTLVDDLQFGRGFVMRNSAPASMWLYKDCCAASTDTCGMRTRRQVTPIPVWQHGLPTFRRMACMKYWRIYRSAMQLPPRIWSHTPVARKRF